MRDPKVIDPPDFDQKKEWEECREWVEKQGGMIDDEGEPNMMAAAGANPGCCSCPNCNAYYWKWGKVIECLDCGLQFPTDWWPMYSYGVTAARDFKTDYSGDTLPQNRKERARERHNKRLDHPYYRYGFENPVEDKFKNIKNLDTVKIVCEYS